MIRFWPSGLPSGVINRENEVKHECSNIGNQDVSSATQATLPPITRLPAEVFYGIAAYLPPVSLISLAITCKIFNEKLSFEKGNYVFYQTLPPALLMLEEQFQHATQSQALGSASLQDASLTPTITSERTVTLNADLKSSITPPTNLRPVARHFSPTPHCPQLSISGDVRRPSYLTRAKVLALGGPYEPLLDYRKEIRGHISHGERCHFCFTNKSTSLEKVKSSKCWGLCFCTDCFIEYAITDVELKKIRVRAEIFHFDPILALSCKGSTLYYRPSVDTILRLNTGCGLDSLFLSHNRMKFKEEMLRLERSKPEGKRRQVRQRLIDAAVSLWQGLDPFPVGVKNLRGETVGYIHNPTLPSAEQWKVFRERFCPIAKLPGFLFPAYKLIDSPTTAEYAPASQWLTDPTMVLKDKLDFSRITNQWLTATALGMLFSLTAIHDPLYRSDGMGGNVSNWIRAAKEWHKRRLEEELASGLVLDMTYITPEMRILHRGMHRGIANLREKLGMPRDPLGPCILSALPESPHASLHSHFAESGTHNDTCVHHSTTLSKTKLNEYFSRIVTQACMRCPESSYLFFPIGLEGLLDHMRVHHPGQFWAGTFHSLV